MSGNNDDDKPESNKIFPLDLASKLTVKPVEIPKGTPLVMTAQPFRGMRVLTQAAAATSTSVTGQTISIVPQGIIKSGETLRSTQLTGIISSHGQSQSSAGLAVSRPTQITLATSIVGQPQTTGTTYHVPRGPAVVANLATPRSAVATPIRTSGIATSSGQGSATGFVTTVRQVAPPRTPSPAGTALPPGTTWLSSGGMQLQTSATTTQLMKNVVSTSGSVGLGVLNTANLQRVSASGGTQVSASSRTQVVGVGRAQPNQSTIPARQAVLHQAITLGQANAQIHSFKPTGSIQALGSTVTLAQVLPNRTQTLVYSGGGTQHFAASPRIAVTGTINSQRQVTATRPGQVMATRLAVPVCMNQNSTRLTVTPATQGTIYTTGARISAVATPAQSTVIGATAARIAAVTSNTPHSASATVGRLAAVSSPPGTLLTTSQTRLTVANPAAAQQQQPSAVVIATQAGRLAASVVSLHPVVVGNTAQGARTIQTQGPKVITQQTQGPAIQLAQIPTVTKQTVLPVTVTVATAPTTRTINVAPAALLSQRPVTVSSSGQTIPIAKVFPQSNRNTLEAGDVTGTVQQTNQPTNVYIHTTPMVRRPTSPGQVRTLQSQGEVQRTPVTTSVTTYSLSSGTTYYYDSGYTVAGGNLVARPYTPSSGSFAAVQQSAASTQIRPLTTQVHGIMSGQSIQFNPVMVVEQKRSTQFLDTTSAGGGLLQQSPLASQQQQLYQQQQQQLQLQDHINPLPSIGKVTSSPRPSILRKRDNEGSPLKAAKNLAPVLASLSSAPASPPSRPDSRGGGVSSGGSTTISATSSPVLGEHEDSLPMPSSNPPVQAAAVALKLEQQQLHLHHHHQQHHLLHHHHDDDKPAQEMSPRKKPRKQQLTGNDLHEPKFNMEDMQFISDSKMKKESENMHLHLHHHIMQSRELVPMTLAVSRTTTEVTVRKPAPASLLNSYRQTWKSTHNHYLRYTDIKPKDERRPTIIDLANQSHVLQTINGWKIHHLSSQMEDLADLETQVYERLSSELKLIETKDCEDHDREFNRINELIKGNMQRSKIINDSVVEAKTQVMKIFDHKENVADIITRCASKRNFKKREKF